MKFFNLISLLSTIAIPFVAANKSEINLPSIVNVEKEGGFALMITRPEYIYDDNNKIIGAVNGDIELKNCKYNFENKRIICDFQDKINHQLILDVKIKNDCKINKDTTFKTADLYAPSFDSKKLNKTHFVAYYERENDKIVNFSIEAKKFEFLTNENCKFIVNIKRATIRKAK